MSAPAKPRCSHFPSPSSSFHHLLLLLLLLGTTSHSHKFNSTHTCSITRKPLCVFSQPNLKALTLNRDLNSSRFTGLWKQQHFGVLLLLTSGRGKGKRGRKGRTFKTRDQARKMSLMGLYERWATSRAHTHMHTHTLPREITEEVCVSRVRSGPHDGSIAGGEGAEWFNRAAPLNFSQMLNGTERIKSWWWNERWRITWRCNDKDWATVCQVGFKLGFNPRPRARHVIHRDFRWFQEVLSEQFRCMNTETRVQCLAVLI